MLTARGEAADRIVGLELGADDYVTKPFSPRELAIRVRNVLKRAESPPVATARTLTFGALTIDGAAREVTLDGEPVRLTGKEFDLLFFLASNPREVFSRKQLMDRVWGYEAALDTGTVTVHIRRLRSKIESDPSAPAAARDAVGCRLPVRAVIHLARRRRRLDARGRPARRPLVQPPRHRPVAARRVRPARRAAAARRRAALGLGDVPHGRRREDPRRRSRRRGGRGCDRARAGRVDHAAPREPECRLRPPRRGRPDRACPDHRAA